MDKDELIKELQRKISEGMESRDAEVQELKGKIKDLEENVESTKSQIASVPGADSKEFQFSKALYGISTGDWSKSGYEKEVFDAASKDMAGTIDADGGYTVPIEIMSDVIENLRANSAVMSAGATILPIRGAGEVRLPGVSSSTAGYWLDENEALTATDLKFNSKSLTPKFVGSYVPISTFLLSNSNANIEQLVRDDLFTTLSLALDIKALNGDGTSKTPIGIKNTPGVRAYEPGTDGDDPNYDFLLSMEGILSDQNALVVGRNTGFVSHPSVFRKIKRAKIPQYSGQTDGQPVFSPIVSDEVLSSAIGHGLYATTQLPIDNEKGASGETLSELYFGDWSQLIIGMWQNLTLSSTKEGEAWLKNQKWIKAVMQTDIVVRQPDSFCYAPYVQRDIVTSTPNP